MRILSLRLTNPMALCVHHCLIIAYSLLLCSSISSCFASWNDVPKCGNFEFGYPFGLKNSGYGDHDFQLQCDQWGSNPLINIGGDDYRILEASFWTNQTMRIINNNLLNIECNLSGNYSQFWSSASHFHMADTYTNLTISGLCDKSNQEISEFRLLQFCGDDWYYDIGRPEEAPRFCKTHLQLPIKKEFVGFNMNQNLPWREGFEVTWHVDPNRFQSCSACLNSNGNCGYNISEPSSTFLCYCPDGSRSPDKCPDNGNSANTEDTGDQKLSAIAIGCFIVGVAVIAIGLAVAVFLLYDACKKRRNSAPPSQILRGNGNDVTNPPYSSSKADSSLFTSTEKSSSIEIGV